MRRLPLVISVAAAGLLAACAQTGATGPANSSPRSLAGTSWILSEVLVDGTMTHAVDASGSLTLGDDGTMSGSTGCNRFAGTWSADGPALTLRTGPVTLMGCSGQLAVQEQAVLAALQATASYRMADDALILLDARGAQVAGYTPAVGDLAGTSWRATGVNNGRSAVVSTVTTGELTLQFGSAGTVSGFGGCSTISGTYTTTGSSLAIAVAPDDGCDDPEQAEYLAALHAATTWRVDGTRLELRDDSGALQAGFVAAP